MELPDIVKAYFDADGGTDPHAVAATFSNDASVMDEGGRNRGADAIRMWWLAAKEKYHYVAVPFEATNTGGKLRVRATVSGRFPGSPATLNYTFTVLGETITELEIG